MPGIESDRICEFEDWLNGPVPLGDLAQDKAGLVLCDAGPLTSRTTLRFSGGAPAPAAATG